jgi:Predicted dehydrogenases and related proteins
LGRTYSLGERREPPFVTSSLDDALPMMDAAIVATPHATHAPIVRKLVDSRVHVLVEKPLALRVHECDDIAAAVSRAGVVLAMGFVRRLFPEVRWMADVIASGRLGAIRSVTIAEGEPYGWPVTSTSLFRRTQAGGGVMTDLGSHVLDTVFYWLSGKVEVVDYADSAQGGVEGEASCRLRVDGIDVRIVLSRLRHLSNQILITGSAATATVGTRLGSTCSVQSPEGSPRSPSETFVPAGPHPDLIELFGRQLTSFVGAVRGSDPPVASVDDGGKVVAVLEECGRVRRPLSLPWL